MSDDFMAEIRQIFIQESLEGVGVMESGLLQLEAGAADPELMNSIFRAAHSIKGGGATFGFVDISEFTHDVETLLDQMRKGTRAVTDDVVQVLLQSVDCIRGMIDCLSADTPIDGARVAEVKASLTALLDGRSADAPAGVPPAVAGPAAPVDQGWSIEFRPHASMLKSCNDPLRIFRELRKLGELELTCVGLEKLDFATLDPEVCSVGWTMALRGGAPRAAVAEVFAWVESECDLTIAPLSAAARVVAGPSDVTAEAETQSEAPQEQPVAALEPAATAPTNVPAVATDNAAARKGGASSEAQSIRVSIDKVDMLINLVGELVITQSMLARFGDNFDISQLDKLRESLAQLTRSTREIQENAMQIRMLPIKTSFSRFPRLVHDLSRKLGKQVELQLEGEDTELDKTVLEKIADPLVHLVRNSLDHGLEKPDVRTAAGKPAAGTLELCARYEGGSVVIEVKDDGGGINKAKVLAKAKKSGIVGPDEELTDDRINNLIFAPGFSTAEVVSDVSGRGVGLDVVRRNIQDLGGHVQVDSWEGIGTVFRIRLPLTLAILDGQLARVGDEIYIFPLISIVETIQVKAEQINRVTGTSELYRVRDELIPIIRLGDVLQTPRAAPSSGQGLLVVAESDGERVGIVVDDLLGQQQVVIKSLQSNFRPVSGFTGATILGDGTVALILDVPGIIALGRQYLDTRGTVVSARARDNLISNIARLEKSA